VLYGPGAMDVAQNVGRRVTDVDSLEASADYRPGVRFSFDRKRPAAAQVYEDLRERIVALEIAPGTSLSRPTLAGHYGLSQTPIRDAILKLEQDGLVEIYPQSRTLVARIDVEDAREIQFLRTAIELEVTRVLALAKDKAAMEPVRELLTRLHEERHADDGLASFARLDRQFHQTLCEAAGHPRLWELVIQRSGHLDRLRRLHLPVPGKAEQILADHEAIVAAILRSDVPGTAEAVRRHLSGTLGAIDRIVAAQPDYF